MQKSPEAFRTIGEVASWLGVPPHVLRFWESKFAQVKPVKRAGGRRYYRRGDMALLGGIKVLLHDRGMTIKGVQRILSEDGAGAVTAHAPELDEEAGLEEPQEAAQAPEDESGELANGSPLAGTPAAEEEVEPTNVPMVRRPRIERGSLDAGVADAAEPPRAEVGASSPVEAAERLTSGAEAAHAPHAVGPDPLRPDIAEETSSPEPTSEASGVEDAGGEPTRPTPQPSRFSPTKRPPPGLWTGPRRTRRFPPLIPWSPSASMRGTEPAASAVSTEVGGGDPQGRRLADLRGRTVPISTPPMAGGLSAADPPEPRPAPAGDGAAPERSDADGWGSVPAEDGAAVGERRLSPRPGRGGDRRRWGRLPITIQAERERDGRPQERPFSPFRTTRRTLPPRPEAYPRRCAVHRDGVGVGGGHPPEPMMRTPMSEPACVRRKIQSRTGGVTRRAMRRIGPRAAARVRREGRPRRRPRMPLRRASIAATKTRR